MAEVAKKWKFLPGWQEEAAEYPVWFLNILGNRKIKKAEIENFLNPKYEDLSDPQEFKGIKEAVKRIKEARDKKESIVVYGDYDVDGICASAIMIESLNKIGIQNVSSYIPHREDEGYGLNVEAVTEIHKKGAALVVAVDCGITSKEIIDSFANRVDFIVCDHHEISEKSYPDSAIIVHPSLVKKGPKREFSAGGMAFYLARALAKEFPNELPEGQEKWLLDLVALSTICDVVPLKGENRILAKWGITVLQKTRRRGLVELMRAAGIEQGKVGAHEAGFIIGPRLNAAGRLAHAKKALNLLLTDDFIKAKTMAEDLHNLNVERQKMCASIFEEASRQVAESYSQKPMLFLSNSKWPRGVVGIIASRVSETYSKPAIIFENNQGVLHGSARSVDGFDIAAALNACSEYLEKFGGHAKAAGLTLKEANLAAFEESILNISAKKLASKTPAPTMELDSQIERTEITGQAVDLLEALEPFGCANPSPVLATKAKIKFLKKVGQSGNHLRFTIDGAEGTINAIYFNASQDLQEGAEYEIAFSLSYNYWKGNRSIQMRVIDMKEAK